MLVSIITPTTSDRAHFNSQLRDMIIAQDYPNLEHILCFDDRTIGEKRNLCIQQAKGDIIVMLDSDDLYAPDYVTRCVAALQSADITGLDNAYFTDGTNAWEYLYGGSQPYVVGSGMAFHRHVWERKPFAHTNQGEDGLFCAKAGKIVPHGYLNGFIARVHNNSTSSHNQVKKMKPVRMDRLPTLLTQYL